MKLYDVVALLDDLPEHNLKRGQVGTLVEEWEPGVFEVEFANPCGGDLTDLPVNVLVKQL